MFLGYVLFHGQLEVPVARAGRLVHTGMGATAPLTDCNVVLHTLLITLRHKRQEIDVDPSIILREHLGNRCIKVGAPPVDIIHLCWMQPVLPNFLVY